MNSQAEWAIDIPTRHIDRYVNAKMEREKAEEERGRFSTREWERKKGREAIPDRKPFIRTPLMESDAHSPIMLRW